MNLFALPKLQATTEETFICTCTGFCGVADTRFAAASSGAGAQVDAIARALITPLGPVAVQDSTVVIQRAPAPLGTITG